MKFKPTNDNILVRVTKQKEEIRGGVVIPITVSKSGVRIAKIVAITDGWVDNGHWVTCAKSAPSGMAITLSVGQTVVLSAYGGNELELNGEAHLVIEVCNVLGILSEV